MRPGQWALRGRVYDLMTLLPVADVQLDVSTPGGGNASAAATDEKGRYVVLLERLSRGSYELHAAKPGYASVALYEADIPYAALSVEKRREIAAAARDGDVPAPPINDVGGEDSVRRDVFLAPQR
jgi:hypothetical protein